MNREIRIEQTISFAGASRMLGILPYSLPSFNIGLKFGFGFNYS
jgi:hypothetical protein